jgi:hypothetical protein
MEARTRWHGQSPAAAAVSSDAPHGPPALLRSLHCTPPATPSPAPASRAHLHAHAGGVLLHPSDGKHVSLQPLTTTGHGRSKKEAENAAAAAVYQAMVNGGFYDPQAAVAASGSGRKASGPVSLCAWLGQQGRLFGGGALAARVVCLAQRSARAVSAACTHLRTGMLTRGGAPPPPPPPPPRPPPPPPRHHTHTRAHTHTHTHARTPPPPPPPRRAARCATRPTACPATSTTRWPGWTSASPAGPPAAWCWSCSATRRATAPSSCTRHWWVRGRRGGVAGGAVRRVKPWGGCGMHRAHIHTPVPPRRDCIVLPPRALRVCVCVSPAPPPGRGQFPGVLPGRGGGRAGGRRRRQQRRQRRCGEHRGGPSSRQQQQRGEHGRRRRRQQRQCRPAHAELCRCALHARGAALCGADGRRGQQGRHGCVPVCVCVWDVCVWVGVGACGHSERGRDTLPAPPQGMCVRGRGRGRGRVARAGGAHIHGSYGDHFPDEGLDDRNYR